MTEVYKKIVVVGATSMIAQHCLRLLLNDNSNEVKNIFLAGRDKKRLDIIGNDLKIRSRNVLVHTYAFDFNDIGSIESFVQETAADGPLDLVFIAHGYLGEQEVSQNSLEECQHVLQINGISAVLFAEAFAKEMQKSNQGQLAIIGSVAGDRGRKSNYIYGAAKSLVEKYAQGLQHRFAKSNVKISLIKPGPTKTPMTEKLQPKNASFANVDVVASQIVAELKKKSLVIYAPKKWRVIMAIVKNMPTFIMHKLDL